MKKVKIKLPLNYITIKTTKNRIDKGLLAIPVSLISMFPSSAGYISIINEEGKEERKIFTPYTSSSRECRIGGLKGFYQKYGIVDSDELVIQLLDDGKYRLIPDKSFTTHLGKQLAELENTEDENLFENKLTLIANFSNLDKKELIKNLFISLSNNKVVERKTNMTNIYTKESVPLSLRKVLTYLYEGRCQLSNFTFLTKNNLPYFELHHIDPMVENHIKNLLVVSPNIHAQFTYANLVQKFDNEGWLREVKLNETTFNVYQIIDSLPKYFEKEIHD